MSDLISRQAAIDAVLHHGEIENNYTDLYYDGYFDGVYDSADMIKDLPSAQPEPKTGRWISDRVVSTNGGTYGVYRCSECEAYYQDIGYGWNYCPNCGARMEDQLCRE